MVAQKQGSLEDEAFVRHVILNSYRNILKQFKEEYGPTMILCYDGSNNWRKKYFPNYKAHRKTKRESDDQLHYKLLVIEVCWQTTLHRLTT